MGRFRRLGIRAARFTCYLPTRVTLPKNIPAEKFWSVTVYDNQSRSMLATPQRFPRAGSQSYSTPAAVPNVDRSTTIYFGPTKPADPKEGNWIQTDPSKGWNTLLRFYSLSEGFFTKEWRPAKVEEIKCSSPREAPAPSLCSRALSFLPVPISFEGRA